MIAPARQSPRSILFSAVTLGATAALAGFFLLLIGTAAWEFWRGSFVSPPEAGRVAFAVRLSLLTATTASLLALAVSLPVSYLLARRSFPGKALIDTLLDLPLVLSPVALGAMLLLFFNTPSGRLLERIIGPVVFEVRGIVIAQFCVVVGLCIRLLKTAFEGVDPGYEEVARTLGLDRAATFFRVTVPLARPGITAAFLLAWARAIGEFGATVVLAGAITFKTETVPVSIYLNFATADITGAVAFILILVAVSLSTLFAVRKIRFLNYG